MTERKNHNIERSHSKRWSKTSTCEMNNYFWDNPIEKSSKGVRTDFIIKFSSDESSYENVT